MRAGPRTLLELLGSRAGRKALYVTGCQRGDVKVTSPVTAHSSYSESRGSKRVDGWSVLFFTVFLVTRKSEYPVKPA